MNASSVDRLLRLLEVTCYVREDEVSGNLWVARAVLRDAGMEEYGPYWVPGEKTFDWILSVRWPAAVLV